MKRWRAGKYDKEQVAALKRRCDLSELTLKVLCARGYNDAESITAFFNSDTLSDPFAAKDMREAVDAIYKAVDNYELICVYGDYDCDGITATAILFSFLQNIGANVMYHIPERSDGYGMSISAVEMLAERGVQLIVTVDNGISAIAEADRIYELGMKLVVTDHHQPSEVLPRAEAVVDMHRADCPSEYKDLAGAGVALKLCIAMNDGDADLIMDQYSDICTLGTIADLVPLTGENRTIARIGLDFMKETDNYGLDCLMDAAGVRRDQLSASTVSFQLSPRINASGRFGSPITAVKALLADDPDDADSYVQMLMTLNEQRKASEANITNGILSYLDKHPEELDQRVLILAGRNWHHGVIGIVASKLVEAYGKPAVLLSIDKENIARGSARSVKGFDIFKCFSYVSDLLEQFGGHECAGGLTVKAENIPEFSRRVRAYAEGFDPMPMAAVECDIVLSPDDITVGNIKDLLRLEPCGEGNPKPVFALVGATLQKKYALSQGKHTKLELSYGGAVISAPMFGSAFDTFAYPEGAVLDVALNLEINSFNGTETVSSRVIDIRYHGLDQNKYFSAKDAYEKYKRGISLPKAFLKRMYPERAELVNTYKLIAAAKEISLDDLYFRTNSQSMNYCKLRFIIDAFAETGLVEFLASKQTVRILPVNGKVDLEAANVLRELKSKL